MIFLSLRSRLLAAVSILVIISGLGVALLVSHRYAAGLRRAMIAQAQSAAQALAYDSADKVLINDLVGLQKLLDQQKQANPAWGYIFVLKDGQVLAHTFDQGMPVGLVEANAIPSGETHHSRELESTSGDRYLDIAWPIFEGKAGVLRLGYNERHYHTQITALWLEIGIFSLCILLAAIMGGLAFIRKITNPLSGLVRATREITQGKSEIRVSTEGPAEIAALAASFNRMLDRQEDYTRRLEDQALELDRAHHQTRAACLIVREISALRGLDEMGAVLLGKLRALMPCGQAVIAVSRRDGDALYILSDHGYKVFREKVHLDAFHEILEGLKRIDFTRRKFMRPPLADQEFLSAERQAVIKITDEELTVAAVVACPHDCHCQMNEIEAVALIMDQTVGAIKRAVKHEEDTQTASERSEIVHEFCGLIGKAPQMRLIYNLIQDVAVSDATVLIQGESGTGKELVARAIHQNSPRRHRPFVVVNCAAYPASLLESELFGHEKGAFTGAQRQKPGRFELADGGTVFLDEIGEVPPTAQIKLLRVLQSRQFERLGGDQTLTVDVRILAATNKDLRHEVKMGRFREDLFYRLNVIPIFMPPLRDRKNDIPLLVNHFLRRLSAEKERGVRELAPDAMRLFLEYHWPGNVRELENTIEHAVVLAKGGEIEVWNLPSSLRPLPAAPAGAAADHESKLFREILEQCNWNKKEAAQRLGVSRNTLYAKIKKYNLARATH